MAGIIMKLVKGDVLKIHNVVESFIPGTDLPADYLLATLVGKCQLTLQMRGLSKMKTILGEQPYMHRGKEVIVPNELEVISVSRRRDHDNKLLYSFEGQGELRPGDENFYKSLEQGGLTAKYLKGIKKYPLFDYVVKPTFN